MLNVIKAWTTRISNRDLVSLTIETKLGDVMGLSIHDMKFPDNPTPEHPLRRTVCLGLLSYADLVTIRNAVDAAMKEME